MSDRRRDCPPVDNNVALLEPIPGPTSPKGWRDAKRKGPGSPQLGWLGAVDRLWASVAQTEVVARQGPTVPELVSVSEEGPYAMELLSTEDT